GARQAEPDLRSAAQRGLADHHRHAAHGPGAGRLRVVAETHMRTLRTPLILFAVALALGGYLWIYEGKRETTEQAAQAARKVTRGFERDKTTSIEIAPGGGEPVVVEKK